MVEHNLKQILDLGLCVMANSDDPAYFGSYIIENLMDELNRFISSGATDMAHILQSHHKLCYTAQDDFNSSLWNV